MMRRIVCAANRSHWGLIVCGARHFDTVMHGMIAELSVVPWGSEWEQGFIDQHGVFLTRTEAWPIAEAAGQIIRRCGGDTTDGGTLYSENLY